MDVRSSASLAPTTDPPRSGRLRAGKLLKLVRRAHMYAGLLLFPWVLLFGISGLLFNHPNVGEPVTGQRLAPERLKSVTGISAWAPGAVAQRLVETLNAAPGAAYTLDGDFTPELTGVNVFSAPAPGGRHLVLLDLQQGAAIVATRLARPQAAAAPFARDRLAIPGYALDELEPPLQALIEAEQLSTPGPLAAHPSIGQQLRLRLRDAEGSLWNATYDLRSQRLEGRRADVWPAIGFTQLMAKLHTTHHFTPRIGALWFWALFEDLLGLTLAFWAGSGLLMAWQMKPTRLAGMICVAIACVIGGVVMWRTTEHLMFGPVRPALGPGES